MHKAVWQDVGAKLSYTTSPAGNMTEKKELDIP